MRLAAAAAPNPLSMLTTVTPDAHELSIPSNAAIPPNDAPYPTLVGTAITGTGTSPPTTLGSGASFGGIAALLGMLNSCASGVTVVNIDNGFGAGFVASLINRREGEEMKDRS